MIFFIALADPVQLLALCGDFLEERDGTQSNRAKSFVEIFVPWRLIFERLLVLDDENSVSAPSYNWHDRVNMTTDLTSGWRRAPKTKGFHATCLGVKGTDPANTQKCNAWVHQR